ncbi:MAG TPA: LON peptidase substrate-binding domain-containing protein [Longimicrobium sp.]|nr:LON peptidase substrate-binding domain-containing protein [Longimicrobium sp.]
MRRLPLFPLPLVLFPGAPLPLHIFEPRYRQMVAHCVEGDSRFGLIYHDPDRHGPYRMDAGGVGTVAEILKFQPLRDGRSLILCRGHDRFRVEDGVESGAMYFEGLVGPYEDDDEDLTGMVVRRRRTIALFHRVLDEVVRYREPYPEIDSHAETGFQVAQAIRIDPSWQQTLLEMRRERERLSLLDDLLNAVLDAGREVDNEAAEGDLPPDFE